MPSTVDPSSADQTHDDEAYGTKIPAGVPHATADSDKGHDRDRDEDEEEMGVDNGGGACPGGPSPTPARPLIIDDDGEANGSAVISQEHAPATPSRSAHNSSGRNDGSGSNCGAGGTSMREPRTPRAAGQKRPRDDSSGTADRIYSVLARRDVPTSFGAPALAAGRPGETATPPGPPKPWPAHRTRMRLDLPAGRSGEVGVGTALAPAEEGCVDDDGGSGAGEGDGGVATGKGARGGRRGRGRGRGGRNGRGGRSTGDAVRRK